MTGDLAGVDDQPVVLVSNNGISAAVSMTDHSDPAPNFSRILAYKNVTESFHRDRTIIPMRYGCLLEDEKKTVQLLKINQAQYEALLGELDGCVEMGIRVLIGDWRLAIGDLRDSESKIKNQKSKTSGRSYLTSRKAHYAQEDNLGKEIDTIIEQYRETFSGLYVKFKTEHTSTVNLQSSIFNLQSSIFNRQSSIFNLQSSIANRQSPIVNLQSPIANPMLSLYFLVRRKSVESFRQAFRQVVFKDHAKLLLSGPWPPFNFVQPDRAPGLNADIRTKPKRRLLNGAEWG